MEKITKGQTDQSQSKSKLDLETLAVEATKAKENEAKFLKFHNVYIKKADNLLSFMGIEDLKLG